MTQAFTPGTSETPRAYLLALFVAVQTMLSIDRAILSVVAEPIKREFGLSDSQLGLLMGFGFAIFFSISGLVIGRAVDRMNRRNILAACVLLFSAATASTALASRFVHIFASRLVVGAGVAGSGPAMISIISDRFPAAQRASALSIFYMGLPLGYIITFLGGGYLAATHGWRTAFLCAGLPGMLLSGVILLTMREPARARTESTERESFAASLRLLLARPALIHVLASVIFTTASMTGLVSFGASVLIRSHGFSLPQAGLAMALALGVAGLFGAPAGGAITDRLARRDHRWRAWWPALSLTLSFMAGAGALLSSSAMLAAGLLLIWGFFSSALYGPALALAQGLAPPSARGTLAAIYYLLGNLVGSACGAQIVGFLSDALTPSFGVDALRVAVFITLSFALWSVAHLLLASRKMDDFQ